METETASHICEWVALSGLKFHRLGKYFMEPSDHDKIYFLQMCKYYQGSHCETSKPTFPRRVSGKGSEKYEAIKLI
jgi:hypothetical protein